MARIDQYQEAVGTPMQGVHSSVSPIVNPQAEINLRDVSQGFANLARAKEESDVNNARAELAALEPQAQLDFQSEYSRVEASWTPEQAPIAVQMRDYIKNYTESLSLKNPKTAPLVQARSQEFQAHYMLKGATQQLGIERDIRVGQYNKAYDDNALIGAQAPEQFGLNIAKLNANVMADDQIPYDKRLELTRKGSNTAALSVAKVQAQENPVQVQAVTGSLLGFVTPELAVSGSVVDAIIQRESGNRLYADSGKILEGPAITTSDGKTVHAYGKYQLLESTAREQAQAMGIPWNRELFFRERTGDAQQDAETAAYHDQLGQGHIAANLARFGDPIVAAAAHNMGPAAAEAWAAGRPYQTQSGKWWRPKSPKDLSAMPEETRKYIDGIGTVTEVKADTSDEYSQAFKLLDADQLLTVYGSAQARLAEQARVANEQRQIEKGFFEQRLQDITVAAKNGTNFDMPGDEDFALLGPVKGVLEKQRLLGLKGMAGQLNAQNGMSNAELQAQTLIPDPDMVEGRENAQAQVDALRSNAQTILTQRQNDPGLAASQAPQAKASIARWAAASQEFYNAGQNATREQQDALNQAQGEYINTNFAIQRNWGVINPKLPKDVAMQVGEGFNRAMRDGNVQQAAARMAVLPKQMGGSHDAIEQVAQQTGDVGRFAMEGVPSGVLNTMFQTKQLKPDELNKQLGGTTPADVNKAVASAFAPLLTSLNAPSPDGTGDAVVANRYLNGGVLLAKSYLASGKASSAKEAANMAYSDLYGNRETVVNGVRIPLSYNAEAVTVGLDTRIRTMSADQLQRTNPDPGFTSEETAARQIRAIQANGRWVTDETGEGAYLMVGGKPVLDASGKPLRQTYQQAGTLQSQARNVPYTPAQRVR